MLIWPFPLAYATEVTVNEDFSDSTYQAGLTISGGNQAAYIYSSEQGRYGTTGPSLAITSSTYTFEFSSDIDVYEVGFVVGAVNYAWSIKWYYADGTDETESKNAQSNSNLNTMYETIYKSYTDYNAVESNTDKFITKFEITLSDVSVLDTLYWQYDDSTSTGSFATTTTTTLVSGIGDPSNLTVSANLHSGEISIDWDAATGYQYDAERYAIAFSNDNFQSMNYAVATGNVGDSNALNTEYTFTKTYLDSDFDAGDTIYFKVRADNDTNSQYSNWTSVASYTIQDVASGVTNVNVSQAQYQGATFTWTQPNTGWSTQTSYKLAYRPSESSEWSYITDISATATSYLFDEVTAGAYVWNLYACTQNGGWCHGQQSGEIIYTINATTPTTTTTVPPSLGPPMNPVVTQEYNVGVKVDWDVANTGNVTADTYELYYRTSSEDEIKIDGITETEYTIAYGNIPNGDYTFSIRGYNSNNTLFSGYSTEPTLTVFNQKAQDDADAQAEADRIAREKAEAEERERREREEREAREEAERIAKEKAIQEEKDSNFAETGYYELDSERADREQREYEEEQERLRLEEEAREKALQEEREANFAETGYMELDSEREQREYEEEQTRIEEEIKNTVVIVTDGEELTEKEEEAIEELVDAIIEIQETVDFTEFEIEDEIIEIDIDLEDVVIVIEPIEEDEPEQPETDTSDSEEGDKEIQPETVFEPTKTEEELEDLSEEELEEYKEERKEVVEAYVEELEEEIIEEVLPETVTVEEFKEIKEKEVEDLTEEEVAIVVEVATEVIEEVVDTEELTEVIEAEDIVILEEEELEDLSKEELEAYEEELEEVIEDFVEELETEELVVVVEQIAEVGVENLAVADEQTIKVVQAVVAEVVDTETVEELSEEEVEAVAEVLGFEEEEDVVIIAQAASKDENVKEAVDEYVERAVENADVENYTLADTVTEVQVEAFLENPVGQLLDVKIDELDISSLGEDMTSDQKEKAQEVVVPVILASQIIAQAGAVLRRF